VASLQAIEKIVEEVLQHDPAQSHAYVCKPAKETCTGTKGASRFRVMMKTGHWFNQYFCCASLLYDVSPRRKRILDRDTTRRDIGGAAHIGSKLNRAYKEMK
jgi:hypothetical protein